MKKYMVMLVVLILVSSPLVFAQSDSEGDGGIKPDSIFWGLDKAFDRLSLAFKIGSHSKALKALEIAKERRLEAQSMVEEEKPEHAEKAMNEWKKNIDRAEKEKNDLEEDGKDEDARNIGDGIENAITVLQDKINKFENDDNPNNDNALKGLNNALGKLGRNLDRQQEAKDDAGKTGDLNKVDAANDDKNMKDATDDKADKTFILTGVTFKFIRNGKNNPDLVVKQGDTVRIEFTSSQGFHDWTVDEFGAATNQVVEIDGSTFVEFVADKTGTFEYYCSVGSHRAKGMKGNLIVE